MGELPPVSANSTGTSLSRLRPDVAQLLSERRANLPVWIRAPKRGPTNGAGHDPTPAEGYVYVDSGIHGIGDLVPAERDWRGPVAEVVIRRVH